MLQMLWSGGILADAFAVVASVAAAVVAAVAAAVADAAAAAAAAGDVGGAAAAPAAARAVSHELRLQGGLRAHWQGDVWLTRHAVGGRTAPHPDNAGACCPSSAVEIRLAVHI